MGDVDILRVRADVDGGRRHLACACGRGWGTWTPCVRADGLLVNADEYKEKKKSTYLAMVTGHMSMRLRGMQMRGVRTRTTEETKKESGKEKKRKKKPY